MAQWDPLDVSLNPLGPPSPLGPLKEISWPLQPLKFTLTALLITWGPIKFHFPEDPRGIFILLLETLRPWHPDTLTTKDQTRPWNSDQVVNSRTYLAHWGLVFKYWSYIKKLGSCPITQVVSNIKGFTTVVWKLTVWVRTLVTNLIAG